MTNPSEAARQAAGIPLASATRLRPIAPPPPVTAAIAAPSGPAGGLLARRGPRQPSRALTAAATQVKMADRTEAKRVRSYRREWQEDAWAYRDQVPEIRYAMNFLKNSCARMKLFVGVEEPGVEVPVLLQESGVDASIVVMAQGALDRLAKGRLAQSQLMGALAEQFEVPGEGWLLGEADPITGQETWGIRSIDEMVVTDDAYKIRELPTDTMGMEQLRELDPDNCFLTRLWDPHPRWQALADSPMRALLDLLEELMILSRIIRATGRSRLAGNGILLVPEGLTTISDKDDDDDDDPRTPAQRFLATLTEAMMTPMEEEGTAASVVPIVVMGPTAGLDALRHLLMDRPIDAEAAAGRGELIRRIATGLDLPSEVITGTSDLNHWSAWQVDDNTFRHHLEPLVIKLVDALTAGYLRPALAAAGMPPEVYERLVIWYDPTELVTHPDRTQDAILLWDRFALSDQALRKTGGFSDADAPDITEFLLRLVSHSRTFDPGLVAAVISRADPSLTIPATPKEPGMKAGAEDAPIVGTQPAGVPGADPSAPPAIGPAGTKAPPPPAPAGAAPAPPAAGPGGTVASGLLDLDALAAKLGLGRLAAPQEPALAAAAPPAPAERISRRMGETDRLLRTKLTVAANAAMKRQLEKAGARIRTKVGRNESHKEAIAQVPQYHVAAALGRAVLAAIDPQQSATGPVDWADLNGQWQTWTDDAIQTQIAAAVRLSGDDMTPSMAETASRALALQRDEAWKLLQSHLTEQYHQLLFDLPADANLEELVPVDTVRGALAIMGGLPAAQTSTVFGDLMQGVAGQALPQLATGQTLTSALSQAGVTRTAYTWVHGPAANPFEPHEALDGQIFADFDSPAIGNEHTFPPNGAYFPGDHKGCFPAGTVASGPAAVSSTLRWYEGPMVEVALASGQFLTATPNHPILTASSGWVPAGMLDDGDEVVRCADADRIAGLIPGDYQQPAPIEDIAGAVGEAAGMKPRSVPVASEHFHGDGAGSEVAVVRTDRLLSNRRDPALAEPSSQGNLSSPDTRPAIDRSGLAGQGCSAKGIVGVGASTSSGLGSGGDGLAPLRSPGPGHQPASGGKAPDGDAPLAEVTGDRHPVHADSLANGIHALTGAIEGDKVIHVRWSQVACHVYNLETEVGWYIADGILAHNCTCDFFPLYVPPDRQPVSSQTPGSNP